MKLYSREMDMAVKWVSSGTINLLRNGKTQFMVSLTKLNDIDSKSAKVCLRGSNGICSNLNILAFLSNLKIAVMGQRSGQFNSLLYP